MTALGQISKTFSRYFFFISIYEFLSCVCVFMCEFVIAHLGGDFSAGTSSDFLCSLKTDKLSKLWQTLGNLEAWLRLWDLHWDETRPCRGKRKTTLCWPDDFPVEIQFLICYIWGQPFPNRPKWTKWRHSKSLNLLPCSSMTLQQEEIALNAAVLWLWLPLTNYTFQPKSQLRINKDNIDVPVSFAYWRWVVSRPLWPHSALWKWCVHAQWAANHFYIQENFWVSSATTSLLLRSHVCRNLVFFCNVIRSSHNGAQFCKLLHKQRGVCKHMCSMHVSVFMWKHNGFSLGDDGSQPRKFQWK